MTDASAVPFDFCIVHGRGAKIQRFTGPSREVFWWECPQCISANRSEGIPGSIYQLADDPHRESRTEIKQRVIMGGGTMDDAFHEIERVESSKVNYVQMGRWFLCYHCNVVIEVAARHYCGAPWQTPEPDIPREWLSRVKDFSRQSVIPQPELTPMSNASGDDTPKKSKYCQSSIWGENGCPVTPNRDAHVCNRYEGHGGDHHCRLGCFHRWTSEDEEAEITGQADSAYERAKERYSR